MGLEITARNENKALQRTEVFFQVKDAKTVPSRKELRPKIAAMLNIKENLVVIRKISHPFGAREASGIAMAYNDEASLKKTEPSYLVDRDLGKKGKKGVEPKKKPEGEKQGKPEGEKGKSSAEAQEKPTVEGEKKPGEKQDKTGETPAEKPREKQEKPEEKNPEEKPAEKPEEKQGKPEWKQEKPADEKKPAGEGGQ